VKVMFDINVVLDIVANRKPFLADSRAAYLRTVENGDDACIAVHAVATLYYLLGDSSTRRKREMAMDWVLSSFKVASEGEAEVSSARTLGFADFEDALVATSARANGCELIVTRNVKDFAHSPVPVKTPSQFLQKR